MGTGCLRFGGRPNKEVDYFSRPLGKLITLVSSLGTNELFNFSNCQNFDGSSQAQ